MRKLNILLVALVGVSTLWITGCNKKDAQNQAANVKFKLTDAPAQFDALNIDVQGIQAHTEAQGWVDIASSLGTINILSYVNGSTALVADAELPAGDVDQIRLVLGSNNSIVVNGTTTQLGAPSSLQGGLVIDVNAELQEGGSYEWTIDFDAAQSVLVSAGGSFELRPVIRLIVDEETSLAGTVGAGGSGSGGINIGGGGTGSGSGSAGGSVAVNGSLMGNVTGSIGAASGLAIITAVSADGQTSVSTVSSVTGNFMLQALAAGNYTISIDPMLPLLSTHTMQNVSVTAGSTTSLGLVAL